jgi:hypothetical protein
MAHSELPIPGYDELAPGDLAARIRSLDAAALETLVEHERQHAGRPAILQLLEHRLQAVRSGAALSDADPTVGGADAGTAPAPDAASPQTEGPPQNPPSQGVPTNPAQPR